MALSDTARRILAEAAQHPHRLASPPGKLPAAACRSVLISLLKQGYVEECAAPNRLAGPRWQQQDGTWLMVRITEVGMAAIGAEPNVTATRPGTDIALADKQLQEPDSAPLAAPLVPEPLAGPFASAQPPSTRPSLRDAVRRVLAAWDDEAGERAGLADAIATLRGIVVKTPPGARSTGIRKPREGTKQQQVLAMLRRPEGTTVAQIAEATGWQAHTARGFFAGLKRRQGIAVEAAERVRQVGPGQEGARGSYTVYRLAEAG